MNIIKNALPNGINVVIVGDSGPGRTTPTETIRSHAATDRIININNFSELKITEAEMVKILVKHN